MRTLRRLLALCAPGRARTIACAALGTAAVCAGVGLMAAAGYLITRAAEEPPILSLTVAIVVVRFLGLVRPLLRYAERLASHDLALRSLGHVRGRVVAGLEPLAPAQLGGHRDGDLLARTVADVDALQGLVLRGLVPPLVALGVAAVCVGATASVLPSAGAALGVGLLVGGLVVPAVALAAGRAQARRRAGARGLLTAELVELLGGAAELVAFGASDAAEERVREADRRLVRLERRAALASGLGEALGLLAAGATTVAVLATAVAAHDAAALDIVLVAALTLLALASFEAVAPLPGAVLELAATVAAGGRVLDLIDAAPVVTDPAEPLPRPARRAPVALEHVTVRYGVREADALRDVGFTLEPGARVALVGPSGAGKTTVVNLLLRFLDPGGGRVTVGGHDVREYRQEDVRGMFAVAGQDTVLFDTTIRTNLLIARPEASDAELGDALRLARLDAWVTALPDGLDTRLGEDGAELSGGQRQRLVVARALVSSAPVLVLDEPTAHLDAATAERLMEDVLDAAGSRAVLLITHRPEGLARMDEVLTLRAGALTRSGR